MSENEEAASETTDDQTPSISEWVCKLKVGDSEAANLLWERYFEKLVAQANRRIRAHDCPKGTLEPEDIAVSVFESLWKGANAGRFQNVTDRDELWWLLLVMTRNKVVSHIRHAMAERRFPGKMPVSLDLAKPGEAFYELVSQEPTAADIVLLEEKCSCLLSLLREEKSRQIAVLRLEGFTIEEMCQRTGLSSATVTRKLKLIRKTWEQALRDESEGSVENGEAK